MFKPDKETWSCIGASESLRNLPSLLQFLQRWYRKYLWCGFSTSVQSFSSSLCGDFCFNRIHWRSSLTENSEGLTCLWIEQRINHNIDFYFLLPTNLKMELCQNVLKRYDLLLVWNSVTPGLNIAQKWKLSFFHVWHNNHNWAISFSEFIEIWNMFLQFHRKKNLFKGFLCNFKKLYFILNIHISIHNKQFTSNSLRQPPSAFKIVYSNWWPINKMKHVKYTVNSCISNA